MTTKFHTPTYDYGLTIHTYTSPGDEGETRVGLLTEEAQTMLERISKAFCVSPQSVVSMLLEGTEHTSFSMMERKIERQIEKWDKQEER